MSRACDVTDKMLNLVIQSFLNNQKTLQNGVNIKISLSAIQEAIERKFNCISMINSERLLTLVQPIIDQRNKFEGTMNNPRNYTLDINIAIIKGSTTSLMQSMVRPPSQPLSLNNPPLPSNRPMTQSPSLNKPLTSLPDLPPAFIAGTMIHRTGDMSGYYSMDSENLKHSKIDCSPDKKCPKYYTCDLDRNKCLSEDIIPATTWLNWKGQHVTGSGKVLIEFLLSQGVPMEDILAKQVPSTYNMDEYVKFLRSTHQPLPQEPIEDIPAITVPPPVAPPPLSIPSYNPDPVIEIHAPSIISARDLPISFSQTIQLGKFTISTKGWPSGLTVIPDFMNAQDQARLFNYISSNSWRQPEVAPLTKQLARDTQQYGYVYDYNIKGAQGHALSLVNNPPGMLKCLADLLWDHKFIPTYPNQILINRYKPGEGISAHADHPMFEDTILSLSLGSSSIMKFKNRNKKTEVDVPLVLGSLLIMSGESRTDWTHEIPSRMSDKYVIPGFPDQGWKRGERISVTFRSVRTKYQGADLRGNMLK